MTINLYNTRSENNQLWKDLTSIGSYTGTLRNESNVVHPAVLIEAENLSSANYAYIPEFKRYYYVREIVSYRTGLWLVYMDSDPLMSFAGEIRNMSVVLEESESASIDNYLLDSRVWIAKVKDKTNIVQFPNGLLTDGEYILITAGGDM